MLTDTNSGRYLFTFMAGTILGLAVAPNVLCGVNLGGTSRHVLAFTALSLAGMVIWPRLNPLVLLAGLVAFGGMIELVQIWPPLGRHAEWNDWFDDIKASSATIGLLCLLRAVPLEWKQSAMALNLALSRISDRKLLAPLD